VSGRQIINDEDLEIDSAVFGVCREVGALRSAQGLCDHHLPLPRFVLAGFEKRLGQILWGIPVPKFDETLAEAAIVNFVQG